MEVPVYPTRSSGNLRMPLSRLNIHRQTVIYNGLKFWNVIPDNLKK